MANVCFNHMEITGNNAGDLISRLIKEQDKTLIEIFTWFETGCYYGLDINSMNVDHNYISMEFTSKWRPPLDDIEKLSKAYPDFLINNRYEESGMGIYGVISYKGGAIVEDTSMDRETYVENYDEDYGENIEHINSLYEESIEDLIEYMKGEMRNYINADLLEKFALSIMEDKDLPLLLAYNWIAKSNADTFRERLKK